MARKRKLYFYISPNGQKNWLIRQVLFWTLQAGMFVFLRIFENSTVTSVCSEILLGLILCVVQEKDLGASLSDGLSLVSITGLAFMLEARGDISAWSSMETVPEGFGNPEPKQKWNIRKKFHFSAPRSMCPNAFLSPTVPYWTTASGEAEPLYRQTLEQREAKLGLRHPHTLRLGNVGGSTTGPSGMTKRRLFCLKNGMC